MALRIVVAVVIAFLLPSAASAAELVPKAASWLATFELISSTDHVAAKTGAAPTCKLSKNGAAGAATTNSVSEIDAANMPGRYKITLTTTETNTAGPLDMACTAAGADQMDYHAVVYDPATANFGVNLVNILGTVTATPATAGVLDVNVKNWNNVVVGSLQAFPPNFASTDIDVSGRLDLSKVNGSAINNLIAGRVDAALGGVTFPPNFSSFLISSTGLAAASTYRKNVAGQPAFPIYMRSTVTPASGAPGLALTVNVSKDGGAFALATGVTTEVAQGAYVFAPSQSDTNCNLCYFLTTGAAAVAYPYIIHTTQ